MSDDSPRRRGPVRRFFGFLGRLLNGIRLVLSNLIFVLLVVLVIVALAPREPVSLPDRFALTLAPSGFLVDEKSYVAPAEMLLAPDDQPMETAVRPLVEAIDTGAEDPRVSGLVLKLDDLLGGGISKLEEIGAAIERFRASDKPVIAVGSLYTQDQYYLASHADEIHLDPMGSVMLTGYANYRTYYKNALDKLAVNFHVFRTGRYKDAVEPFLRDDMSEASREHTRAWLTRLWGQYTSRVEARRQLPSGAIDDYIATMDKQLAEVGGSAAQLALENRLIDGIKGRRERQQLLTERFGQGESESGYPSVSPQALLADQTPAQPRAGGDRVAIVQASGTIVEGEAPTGQVGSESFRQRLDQVRQDPGVKAVVVRIDSGGGSAYASEIIREELAALRAEGMPVLVSMGSLAASGGYWMATGADEIWATPTTLTGSIGVFGALPTFEDSLDKIGINVDGVGTTPLAGAMRLDRTLTPQAERIIQRSVEHIYQQFIDTVARARGLAPEQVEQIAQGRVWTGAQAKELGLVDRLGSLQQTIEAAAGHAGLEDYEVHTITRPLSPFEQLIHQLDREMARALVPDGLGPDSAGLKRQLAPLLEPLRALSELDDPRTVYARCMECLAP